VTLYGSEVWTLTVKHVKLLEVFEIRTWRQMEDISRGTNWEMVKCWRK